MSKGTGDVTVAARRRTIRARSASESDPGGVGGIEPLAPAFTEPCAGRYTTCRISPRRTGRVIPGGFEPPISSVSGRCPGPLDDRISCSASARIRTWNTASEARRDVRFTTKAFSGRGGIRTPTPLRTHGLANRPGQNRIRLSSVFRVRPHPSGSARNRTRIAGMPSRHHPVRPRTHSCSGTAGSRTPWPCLQGTALAHERSRPRTVARVGVEPTRPPYQDGKLPLHHRGITGPERPVGVEPTHPPWQGSRLPLHHGRGHDPEHPTGVEPVPRPWQSRMQPFTPQVRHTHDPERPAGFAPAKPPWEDGVFPPHHGRELRLTRTQWKRWDSNPPVPV